MQHYNDKSKVIMTPGDSDLGWRLQEWRDYVELAGGRKTARRKTARRKSSRRKTARRGVRRSRRGGEFRHAGCGEGGWGCEYENK